MEDDNPHQSQAPWPPRPKVKVVRSCDQSEPSWPNAVPVSLAAGGDRTRRPHFLFLCCIFWPESFCYRINSVGGDRFVRWGAGYSGTHTCIALFYSSSCQTATSYSLTGFLGPYHISSQTDNKGACSKLVTYWLVTLFVIKLSLKSSQSHAIFLHELYLPHFHQCHITS